MISSGDSSDNGLMDDLVSAPALPSLLKLRLEPLRNQLAAHPLYVSIRTIEHVRVFMESHIFAVWDFMSLLKSLQRTLTCVEVPWVPTAYPSSRRFINEIVLGEESDEYEGRAISHFELYLEAMERAGADTRSIRRLIDTARLNLMDFESADIPLPAREFLKTTFTVIREGSPAAQAAAFAFGREDVIPHMFRKLVRQISAENGNQLATFLWYLERHIEVDGKDHGPLALNMVSDLCAGDSAKIEEVAHAAEQALEARIRLWDGILDQIA